MLSEQFFIYTKYQPHNIVYDFHMIFKAESNSIDRSLQRHIQSYYTSLMNCWPWVIIHILGICYDSNYLKCRPVWLRFNRWQIQQCVQLN